GASFAGSVLYLVSKEEAGRPLEKLIFRTGYYGYALFTVSMVIGGIWAYLAWGTYWLWKVKELWSFLIWIYYAGFLHAIYVKKLRGRGVAWLSIIGFAITMFTYLGVGIMMKSTHQL
ncbi:MAG TPA: cytochrome c biogenesis protein CcsA, partial [Nitrospirota bacterium]